MPKMMNECMKNYKEDAMTKSKCLICGEHVGEYVYRGKTICTECMKFIRSNY
jgi:hypothetical protein